MTAVLAYQHGIHPRSEALVAATRDLEHGRATPEAVEERLRADEEALVRVQREAGLDLLSDGLLRWQDIFRPFAEAARGMDVDGLVRWFDNNSFFRAPDVTGPVSLDSRNLEVFEEDRVPDSRVATLPSPYLFSRAAKFDGDRTSLMLDLARDVLRPVAEALAAGGYGVIHLQEPWLVYFGIDPDEWDPFEKALAEIGDGLGARVHLHTYFGDAAPWADRLRALPVDAIGVDLVETDLEALNEHWEVGLVAGVLDGRATVLEPVEDAAELALRAAHAVEPATLHLSSSSDLELLPREIADAKVRRLGEIARHVKDGS